MKKSLLWIAAGAAALYFISRYSFSKKATFFFKGLQPAGTLFSPKLIIFIGVQNPTNSTVTVKSITGSVNVNGKFLSSFSYFGDQVISPNAESILQITARPSAIGIFNSIKQLLNTPTGNNLVELTGTANVEGVTYPLNESINL